MMTYAEALAVAALRYPEACASELETCAEEILEAETADAFAAIEEMEEAQALAREWEDKVNG